MVAPWIADELRTADPGDKRLDRRFNAVLEQLSQHAAASIPAACGGYAETAAAYRLFDSDKVTLEKILAPHREATRQRLQGHRVVVLVQDTTEIDVTRPERQMGGAGPLDAGARRGPLLHLLHAFTPDGTPLGTLHHQCRARDDAGPSAARRRTYKRLPLADKEAHRWLTALQQARAEAERLAGTTAVAVADSEADIYEVLAEGQRPPPGVAWVVRAAQNRAVTAADTPVAAAQVREQVLAGPTRFTKSVAVRGRTATVTCEGRGRRQSRDSRTAHTEVRAASVPLRPPYRAGTRLDPITVNVVLVREPAPPDGEPPLEWLLLTNLPIGTAEQIDAVIHW
jgi:hypothetical protein